MNSKLIIATDLGRLKAWRLETTLKGTPRLVPLEQIVFEQAHGRLVDKVSDLAGRHVSPTAKQWGAPLTDDHNLRLEFKRRLIREIAGHIKRLGGAHRGLSCALAAPREHHHLIVNALPATLRARIKQIVPRDLVKATQKELLQAFIPAPNAKPPRPRRAKSPARSARGARA